MKNILIALMTAACLFSARAAINVDSSGSGVITFNLPAGTNGWTTLTNQGADIPDTTALFNAVNTNVASQINQALPTTATVPNISSQNMWRYNTANQNLQSVVTGVAYTTLLATLLNTSGSDQNSITVTFDLGEVHAAGTTVVEELPGVHVYYSVTGAAGSWTEATALSRTTPGNVTATVNLSSTWANNTELYFIFADDNAVANRDNSGNEEGGYTLDNVSFVPGVVTTPLSVTLVVPTNTSVFAAPANVPVTATTAGSTPATSVTFFTNNVQYASVTASPYNAPLSNLAVGTYSIYARAVNASETAFSATNVITVRPPNVSYTGGTLTESFDSMGATGGHTPTGWYVGAVPPVNSLDVVPDNGSLPISSTLGFNYGTTGDGDRALGNSPTGNERNTAVRIQNNTSSNIVSIEIHFDGEVWRNYTNPAVVGVLSNLVSFDGGATWVHTPLDFVQPFPSAEPQTPLNGNDPANRTANITGTITAPAPVPPGGIIQVRWLDPNEGGTDGGLAIDNFSFTASFSQFQPFVLITNPTNDQHFAAGAPITVSAVAAMANPVTNVTFFHDANVLIGSDATAPYSVVYSNAGVGAHTLIARAQDSLGNIVNTTNVINITVDPNILPSITLTNPADTSFVVGANITNFVTAADPDGSIARVDYYVDGVLVYTDATPAKFEYGDALAGTHVISAIAVDNAGGTASNGVTINVLNPPGAALLLTNGATWKYFDEGTDPGATWNTLAFNDTAWSNGVAEIGFGDNAQDRPERTVLRRIAGVTNTITYYFRRQVVVTNLALFSTVDLHLIADDGAVVYINGAEVYRTTNMTANPVTFTTFADDDAPGDGAGYFWNTNLPSSVLVSGTNIVAVEVHQTSLTSSDVSFDLMLHGAVASGPRILITRTSATQAELAWPDSFTGYLLEFKTDLNAANWTPETAIVTQSGGYYRATVNTASGNKFWRLHKPL